MSLCVISPINLDVHLIKRFDLTLHINLTPTICKNLALNNVKSVTKDALATLDCRVADCTNEEVVKRCPITCRWFDEIPTNGMTCDLIERIQNIGDYNCSDSIDVTINCNLIEHYNHILIDIKFGSIFQEYPDRI